MEDLKDYDNAVIKFRKSLSYSLLPILSWDFYAQNLDAIKKSAEDMSSLLSLASANAWNLDTEILDERLKADKNVIVVTDSNLNIVFATKNIWDMNQYHPKEIIGQKPKMFQGEKTSPHSLRIISDAIKANEPFDTTVINYRKDGSTYNCWIQGQPVFNKEGKVVNFIAFEKEVA